MTPSTMRSRGVPMLLGIALAGLAASPVPAASSPTRAKQMSAPPTFGTFVPSDPYGGSLAATNALQRLLGRRIGIVHWYQSWNGGDWVSRPQTQLQDLVRRGGRIPLVTWEAWDARINRVDQPGYDLASIVAGTHDAYIASWADALRATGAVVHLRPLHECNGDWYPWGAGVPGNSGALYVRAWRHMHDIFDARGATNVRWVWTPSTDDQPASNRLERCYPGTRYVDVLGMDGYNWGPAFPQYGGWRSFSEVFWPAYDRLRRLGPQPIWITEAGSAQRGGDKAAWVRDMWRVAARWSRLKAIVWFHLAKERDWRATSSARAARAFRTR